jgi:hypothetical protein
MGDGPGGASASKGGQDSGAAAIGGQTGSGGSAGVYGSSISSTLDTGGSRTGGSASGGAIRSSGGANTGGVSGAGGASGSTVSATLTGGTLAGGTLSGGMRTGGTVADAGNPPDAATDARTGDARTDAPGSGDAGDATPSARKTGEEKLTSAGLTVVSYGGYLNGESFQQEGVLTFNGYQYTAFWNKSRHVVLARRQLPSGAWSSIEFTDYTNKEDDAHNTISLGVCPGDGTLHLAFDHHSSDLHYRKSVADFVTNPAAAAWNVSSFSATTNALVTGSKVTQVTYPRFVTEPEGGNLLFDARIGTSGSGDEVLWEYDGTTHAWRSLGMFISGIADSINAYPHGLSYSPGGTRLHISWCWRETPDANTNHDLFYAYSDDHGRTFKNNAGTTIATSGTAYISKNTASARVWTIGQNSGLINQEHMIIDLGGRVHVLLSHMPDGQADDSNFDRSRGKSEFFHYLRATDGTWSRHAMGLPVVANLRGKLAAARSGNLYAVLPDLRIAAAAPPTFATWTLLSGADAGRFFSDPLVDSSRLLTEDKLTVVYPAKNSGDIYVLDYDVR